MFTDLFKIFSTKLKTKPLPPKNKPLFFDDSQEFELINQNNGLVEIFTLPHLDKYNVDIGIDIQEEVADITHPEDQSSTFIHDLNESTTALDLLRNQGYLKIGLHTTYGKYEHYIVRLKGNKKKFDQNDYFEDEDDYNPYENSGWAGVDWFCIRCGSKLRELNKPWPSKMLDGGAIDYLCSNDECCHYNAPLTLFNANGSIRSKAGDSYAIGFGK